MTIICEQCSGDSKVSDSRGATPRWRRRVCCECGHTWTTYEISGSVPDITESIKTLQRLQREFSTEVALLTRAMEQQATIEAEAKRHGNSKGIKA